MTFPDTRFERRTFDEAKKEVVHIIDQFTWFSQGFNRLEPTEEEPQYSIVQFNLPKSAKLYVIGAGIINCNAFFNNGRMYELFAYNLGRSGNGKKFSPRREEANITGFDRFTTHIDPFLHEGGYPLDFSRVYLFPLFGSEYLEVKTAPAESLEDSKMHLSFIPDSRYGKKRELAEIFFKENICDWKNV